MRPVVKPWSARVEGRSANRMRTPASAIALRSRAPKKIGRVRRPEFAGAETLFAAEIKGQVRLQLLAMGRQKTHHAAEVIVVAVRQEHGIELRRVDAQQIDVVVEGARGEAEVRPEPAGSRRRARIPGAAPAPTRSAESGARPRPAGPGRVERSRRRPWRRVPGHADRNRSQRAPRGDPPRQVFPSTVARWRYGCSRTGRRPDPARRRRPAATGVRCFPGTCSCSSLHHGPGKSIRQTSAAVSDRSGENCKYSLRRPADTSSVMQARPEGCLLRLDLRVLDRLRPLRRFHLAALRQRFRRSGLHREADRGELLLDLLALRGGVRPRD